MSMSNHALLCIFQTPIHKYVYKTTAEKKL